MNNFAQNSNYSIGISFLGDENVFYAQSVTLPGFNFTSQELAGSGGSKVLLGGDSITYDACSVNIILDEKLNVYKEIIKYIIKLIDPVSGKFSNDEFNVWITLKDNLGADLITIEYYGCRLESVAGLDYSSVSEDEEILLPLTFKFDEFVLKGLEEIPTLQV